MYELLQSKKTQALYPSQSVTAQNLSLAPDPNLDTLLYCLTFLQAFRAHWLT